MSNLPVPIGGAHFISGSLTQAPETEAGAPALTDVLTSAAAYALAEKADNTRRAYRADFAHFTTWCESVHRPPLPASIETVAAYLAHLADSGLKASTISRRTAAITYAHRIRGCEPPTNAEPVKAVLRGIRRRIGVSVERKAPATARALAGMLKRIPDTLAGRRDRALLLVGFAAALRRSELVALDVGDIERVDAGVIVHIRQSKTDQEGEGAEIPIPRGSKLKPVETLEAWIVTLRNALLINSPKDTPLDGPLFRPIAKGGRLVDARLTDRSVADIVKKHARAAKLDPSVFSGHSLRAGFVTSALESGADALKVMDITRHRRVETLRVYDRRAKAFRNHAGKEFL